MVNNAEPSWKIWKCSYWFDLDEMPTIENGYALFLPLMRWQAWSLKTCCQLSLCTWHSFSPNAMAWQGATGNATIMYFDEQNGVEPIQGVMRYMHGLRWRLEAPSGPNGRSIWRGCLDASQLVHPNEGRVGLGDVPSLEELNREMHLVNQASLWAKQVRMADKGALLPFYGQKRVIRTSGPLYSEMHSTTRWMRRLKGKGFSTFGAMFDTVRALVAMWWIYDGIIKDGGEFTYSTQFLPMVSALQAVIKVSNEHKAYFEDADENDQNGSVPPKVRYGITCDLILSKWEQKAQVAKDQVPELMKMFRPFEDAQGDEYMMVADFAPYQDLAGEFISALAPTLDWDWSNFKAYPNQQSPSEYAHLPDAIELLL